LTPEVALFALGFGVLVSTIFALYPAWRASKLRPVEALRYE
jgi:ABC-type antimicrobial peptide transport system permease subunit